MKKLFVVALALFTLQGIAQESAKELERVPKKSANKR